MDERNHRRTLLQFGEATISDPSSTAGHKLHQPPPRVPRSIHTPPKSDALFSSSLAVAILVLLSALFFLGFISLYIRRFAQRSSSNTAADDTSSAAYHRQEGPPPPLSGWRPSSCAANRKGLGPAVIASLPTRAYGGTAKYETLCAVCLSEFEEGERVKVIPHCEHVFHVECIDRWLYAHVSCPVCRATQLLNVREKEKEKENTSCSVGARSPTHVAVVVNG